MPALSAAQEGSYIVACFEIEGLKDNLVVRLKRRAGKHATW
jgi:hypothetical protein